MATPPHHHHHPQPCCCCPSCYSHPQTHPYSHPNPYPYHSHSSHPPPTPTDHLLQSIATHLSHLSSLSSANLKSSQQNHHQQTQTLLLQSLHHRISSLESSLQTLSSSPPPKPTTPVSLRDLAARTIQTRFRSFLVRRSQTLRHLKDLALIRSHINNLKSPLSDKTQLAILFQNTEPYSQKSMELLSKLDSIQSGDAMIKEGKRSVRKELVGFLKFVDSLNSKNSKKGSLKTRGFNHEPSFEILSLDGRVCEEDRGAILEKLRRGVEGNGVFEGDHGGYKVVFEEKDGLDEKIVEIKNGDLGLFAPLPLKMEDPTRSEMMDKMFGGYGPSFGADK